MSQFRENIFLFMFFSPQYTPTPLSPFPPLISTIITKNSKKKKRKKNKRTFADRMQIRLNPRTHLLSYVTPLSFFLFFFEHSVFPYVSHSQQTHAMSASVRANMQYNMNNVFLLYFFPAFLFMVRTPI